MNKRDPYGRLMKKEDIPAEDKHFNIQEYSWMNLTADDLVFPDNPRASIVTEELHDPEELKARVLTPEQFTAALRAPIKPLFPVDLSEDYRKFVQETIQRKKRRNLDDDDASAIDFSEIATPDEIKDKVDKWKSKAHGESEKQPSAADRKVETGASAEEGTEKVNSETAGKAAEPLSSGSPVIMPNSEESKNKAVAQEIASANEEARATQEPKPSAINAGPGISTAARDAALAKLNARMDSAIEESNETETSSDTPEESHNSALSFETSPESLSQLEDMVAEESAQQEAEEPSAQDSPAATPETSVATEEQIAEAIEKGVAQGLEQGIEEGKKQSLESMAELHGLLQKTTQEVNEMKNQVLKQGQDIFVEILKISAEKLLRSQLKFSDEQLNSMFKSVIDSSADEVPVTISAHPETLNKLKSQFAEAKLPFSSVEWSASPLMQEGDFSFDTKDQVIKSSLDEAIAAQVKELTRGLFGESSAESNAAPSVDSANETNEIESEEDSASTSNNNNSNEDAS